MKTDYVRRIDQGHPGNGKRAYGVPTSSGTGLPYSASLTPQPITIPVALETGKLHPGWLPDFAPNSGYGEGSPSGQQIIAPWVYLVAPLPVGATTITVTGNGLAVGDNITLSHASMPNEAAAVVGGPVQVGAVYEYTLSRPNEQHDYPAYTRAYNRGSVSDGGWISVVSGDQSDNLVAPHINLWTYDADGNEERRVRIGRLQGLSAGEKAQFPKVEDWNVYGLYADAAYLRGQIVADSGDIAGNLDVGGTLGVWSGLGRAGVVLGNSEGGHGITLQNREGRPVFGAVSPYEDESGVLSDVAVWIENKGEKGLYYHLDPATDEYRLEIGVDTLVDGTLTAANILAGTGTYPGAFTGMRLGSEGFFVYGEEFLPEVEIPVDNKPRLYFGLREGWLGREGMTLDTRLYDTDKAFLEHAVRWIHGTTRPSAPDENIGAAVGSGVSASGHGYIFMHTERSLHDLGIPTAAPDDFVQAGLMAFAGGTSTWYGQTLNIAADSRLFITAAGGQTSSFERDRALLPGLTVGSTALHSTDDGLTVGFGTQAAGSAARVVIEQDNRPAFRAQRGDHYMTIALASYIPSGQQSAPPGGYVMRANSTIGISQSNASAEWIAIQNWLRSRGLQPYTPQLAILANQNIATQYDEGTSGLDWSASAIDATKLFPAPLIFDYIEFFYKTSPDSLAWTLSGSPVTQDDIDPAVMATVLANTLDWFQDNGILEPWIMIDEPPHGTSDRWTQAIEDRVVKFTAAAVAAGWTVGVAVPGPSQLAYWRTRLTPTRWILAAKHERNEYATNLPAAQIWLYNRTNKAAGKPMTGLAQQMRDFGAVGYLHWSADSSTGTWPLVTLSGLTVTATDYGTQLIEELRLFAETDVPPAQPVYEQWLTTTGSMILNPRSGYVLRPPNFAVSLGAAERPFEHVYAKHLHGALGSQIALVSGSSMYISAWSPVQAVGLELANTVVYFEQSDLPVGKFLRATNPDDDSFEVIKVLSTGLPAGDWWEYQLERGLAGTQQYWPEGTTWVDLGGNATDGYVRMWGADDENPNTGPAIVMFQRDNDDLYSSVSERLALGNLNGWYGYTANTWGLAAGRHEGAWFAIDPDNGLRMMYGDVQLARYAQAIDIGQTNAAHLHIDADDVTLYAGDTAMIELLGTGDANITGTLAVATGGAITWAGGKGVADDTGLQHVEDANNYVRIMPGTDEILMLIASDYASGAILATGSSEGVVITGLTVGGGVGITGQATTVAGGVGVVAAASAPATTALQIVGGIVDGGSQRYTAMADATAATDGLNRQTGDGRYMLASAETNYLLAAGTRTGATAQAQTLTLGVNVGTGYHYAINSVKMLATHGTLNYMVGPAGNATMSGDSNMLMGSGAGIALTTGAGNLLIGVNAGAAATEATSVVAMGTNAARTLTTGYSIVALGQSAAYTTNGNSATYIGTSAGYFSTGNNNVVIGTSAGYGATGASTYAESVLVGNLAGNGLTTGGENVMIGFWAGRSTNPANETKTGLQNTFIGTYSGQASATQRNRAIALGYRAFVDADNTCVIGGVGFFRVKGVIGATTAGALWDVVGGADELQMRVKGYSSQTAALFQAQDSSANVQFSVAATGGITVNEQGADSDSRFEGDTDANLLFLDASTDRIGIGTASPGYKLDVAGAVNVTTGNVYRVAGTQVVASQGAAVADASGGATIDAEARTAINTLLARLRTHGLIAT